LENGLRKAAVGEHQGEDQWIGGRRKLNSGEAARTDSRWGITHHGQAQVASGTVGRGCSPEWEDGTIRYTVKKKFENNEEAFDERGCRGKQTRGGKVAA